MVPLPLTWQADIFICVCVHMWKQLMLSLWLFEMTSPDIYLSDALRYNG